MFKKEVDIFSAMLVFVPLSLFLKVLGANEVLVFGSSVLALVPLTRHLGKAIEDVSVYSSPAAGAVIYATFGNAAELIIGFLAVREGLIELVKASITGSIISNILLLVGLSMLFGGLKYKEQSFDTKRAGISSTMLIIAIAGLTIPTLYSLTTPAKNINTVSYAVSISMALIYIAGLLFTFMTHKHMFDVIEEYRKEKLKPGRSLKRGIAVLIAATLIIAVVSQLLVGAVEAVSGRMGITQTFIGMVLIAIITNISENTNAVAYARKNRIELSIEIGSSSAIQIALFVVPLLVFASTLAGKPITLVFNTFQVVAMIFAVMIVNYLSADGKCNWLEGAQLLAMYLIIAAVSYFV